MSEAQVIELPVSSPRVPTPKKVRARRVIAVGGGKGGIGKSLLSANLGIALARRGAKVVLADLDLGGANLHTCLGVPQPRGSLSDFIERRVASLSELLVPTPHENLSLLSGAMDGLEAANPRHQQKSKLLRNLRNLDVDYVLLDLGAGTAFNVLDFFLVADTGIVVMLPEPTSIENAYRFIKSAFFRRLQALAPDDDFASLVGSAAIARCPRSASSISASGRTASTARTSRSSPNEGRGPCQSASSGSGGSAKSVALPSAKSSAAPGMCSPTK